MVHKTEDMRVVKWECINYGCWMLPVLRGSLLVKTKIRPSAV